MIREDREDEGRRLPFSVIDEAVHLLDTPAEPWSIQLEVDLSGRLDEGRLRKAVAEATTHHPMSRVRQVPARLSDRHLQWEITPELELDPVRVVECRDEDGLTEARARLQSIDVPLVESPPWRLWLARRAEGGTGDVLMLNVNHAAFDGFGSVRLLQSVARAYTAATDPLPAVELAEARDVTGHLQSGDARVRAERLREVGDKVADVVRAPARLSVDGGVDEPGYGFHHVQLSVDESEKVSSFGGESYTVNDLLLAALNLAVEGWNAEHGAPCRRIGVLMPVNLRPEEWQADMVTNFVLDTRVSTTPAQRRSSQEVLDAISGQTTRIKRWGGGAALIEVLGLAPHLPLWAKQPASPLLWVTGNRLVDTALLSNLGPVKDLPDFGPEAGDITGMWFSAPTRMPCGVSVGAASAGGRLCLSFRYRRPQFGTDAARRFAQLYRFELLRLAE